MSSQDNAPKCPSKGENLPPMTVRNPDTDWLSHAQMGAFMHYLPNDREHYRFDSDETEFWGVFDVAGLDVQLKDAGAAYLGFTLGQNEGYINAPNPVYDEICGYRAGERCSKRDLPMELATALREQGIRLLLYLPCQPPTRDLQAIKAFGFPDEPLGEDRQFLPAAAEKWSQVIAYWSRHYGDLVSGWWFDGAYDWLNFNDAIAACYAPAAKSGNPHAIVTFNPGIGLRRARRLEDYTAGELTEPFESAIDSRWVDGSQAHVLTYLGDRWGRPNCRFADADWLPWLQRCFRAGAAVTLDMSANRNPNQGTVGLFCQRQIEQFKRLRMALV